MYLLYKNKYGLLAGFIGLFDTLDLAREYISKNDTCNFTYKIDYVEKIGVSEINGV